MTLNEIFIIRGNKAKIAKAVEIHPATVGRWAYIPDRHLKAVSQALGIPQKNLPRKGDAQ